MVHGNRGRNPIKTGLEHASTLGSISPGTIKGSVSLKRSDRHGGRYYPEK
jgi:hypothetical protein